MTLTRKIVAAALVGGLMASSAMAKPPKAVGPPPIPAVRDSDWVKIDPDNLLVVDTTRGRLLVELVPSAAPQAVERIKLLARQHFYDGLVFFRVIDQFMAQTGDPENTGVGGSTLPNLPGEFTFQRTTDTQFVPMTSEHGEMTGLMGSIPVGTQSDALLTMSATGAVSAWGKFCPGVIGMARTDNPDTANSQFFIIRQSTPSIDQRYTVVGRVLVGEEFVRLIKVGEPVAAPADKMTRVRLASDLPAGESVHLSRLNPEAPAFIGAANFIRDRKGADFTVCDIDVPVQGDTPAAAGKPAP